MLRFGEIVFGPIHSRRLGHSLGINLLPGDGKICNFDCIYCECGWNADGRTGSPLPAAAEVSEALEARLKALRAAGSPVDSITFSGSGEPTLHPEFAQIVEDTVRLRDSLYPEAKVSVLSNATRLGVPGVVEALQKVDNPILKLDAPTDELVLSINNPTGKYSVGQVVENMKKFKGNFILQTMFLCGAKPDYSNDAQALDAWMKIVRELSPRLVMVYTLDRPAPDKSLSAMPREKMEELLRPLTSSGINVQIN